MSKEKESFSDNLEIHGMWPIILLSFFTKIKMEIHTNHFGVLYNNNDLIIQQISWTNEQFYE